MARRRKSSPLRGIVVLAIVVAVAAGAWYLFQHRTQWLRQNLTSHHGEVVSRPANPNDAETARDVQLSGRLVVSRPPRDAQFGISADAALLLRHVEMYRWIEHCEGDTCSYSAAWSAQAVDSHKFRQPQGHENPSAPFADAHFVAGDISIGGVAIDPDLVIAKIAPVDFPVRMSALSPNLAATFRERDGVLYAGGDPAHPAAGELRVSYRIIPVADVTLSGVQRGNHLSAH